MDDVLPKRKKLRLPQFEYGQGNAYFVTICSKNKQCMFGTIVGNGLDRSVGVKLSREGKIAADEMLKLPQHYPEVHIEKYVVMPNHVHAIIYIEGNEGEVAAERSRPFPTLPGIIGLYKSGVSRLCDVSIWQKSYYEHIIRGPSDYNEIWQYIENNPLKWAINPIE